MTTHWRLHLITEFAIRFEVLVLEKRHVMALDLGVFVIITGLIGWVTYTVSLGEPFI